MPLFRDRRGVNGPSQQARRPSHRPEDHRGREVRGRYGLWRPWFVVLPSLSLMIWASMFILGAYVGPSSMLSLRLALISIACLVAIVPALISFRAHPARVIPRRLAAGKCGACAYPLRKLPRELDGCTVCPECGAAWKLRGGTERRSEDRAAGSGR